MQMILRRREGAEAPAETGPSGMLR